MKGAQSVDEFRQVWRRFSEERRLEFGGHTDPTWRGDHDTSASFIVEVETERFARRLDPLREALSVFPFVSLHPDHFMHISLVFAGFLSEREAGRGEVSRSRLEEIEDRGREAVAGFGAFRVRLANLNAFPGAAFIEAHDAGQIRELRELLKVGCNLKGKAGAPHLTLAYFQAPDGTLAPEALIETVKKYRDWPVGEIEVEEVELSLLNLEEDYAVPKPLARLPLG